MADSINKLLADLRDRNGLSFNVRITLEPQPSDDARVASEPWLSSDAPAAWKQETYDNAAVASERKTYTVREVAEILEIDPKGIYTEIRNGTFVLPHLAVGRRVVILRAPLHRMLGLPYETKLLDTPRSETENGSGDRQ